MTNHIKELHVNTYRGIKELSITNLGKVNIFVGDNNVGKTSVLEAIELLCNPSLSNLIRIARQREVYRNPIRMSLNLLDSLLYVFDVEQKDNQSRIYSLEIGGNVNERDGSVKVWGEVVDQFVDLDKVGKHQFINQKKLESLSLDGFTPTFVGEMYSSFPQQLSLFGENSVKFEVNEFTVVRYSGQNELIKVHFIHTGDHILENVFGSLIRNKVHKIAAVQLLKEFDESIVDIRYINEESRFVPVIENTKGNYIPLSLYGDGMRKALTMLNAIIKATDGVVLIDEFETALHTSAMKQVFQFLLKIAKQMNVQLFLTTHSIEAVDKLLQSAEDTYLKDIRVIRLKKKEGVTYAKNTNGEQALEDRIEYNMELRI